MELKTSKRKETEALWRSIYADFLRLYRNGNQKMPIYERLAKKYAIHPSYAGIVVRKMAKGGRA